MKPIHKPLLPPKTGYVEVLLDTGERTYMNVITKELIGQESPSESEILSILLDGIIN